METEPTLFDEQLNQAVDEELSAADQIKVVANNFRALVNNELSYYKARLAYTRSVAKWTSIYLLISASAFLGSIVACILGALLILSSYLGPIIGTVMVAATSLMIAIIFAVMAGRKSKDFRVTEIDEAVPRE